MSVPLGTFGVAVVISRLSVTEPPRPLLYLVFDLLLLYLDGVKIFVLCVWLNQLVCFQYLHVTHPNLFLLPLNNTPLHVYTIVCLCLCLLVAIGLFFFVALNNTT